MNTPAGEVVAALAALTRGDAPIAERCFREILAIHPDHHVALHGLGKALHDQLRLDEAEQAFRAAGQMAADSALSDYHVGLIRLLRGDHAAGGAGWEARLHVPALGHPAIPLPPWTGTAAPAERILILGEQGYGDVIQFARFLPAAAAAAAGRAADLTLGCAPPLLPLLAPFCAAHGTAAVTGTLDPRRFDRYAWLCSLPSLAPAMPAGQRAYLSPPTSAAELWRGRRPDRRLCVGLCWEGRASHPQDHQRSITPRLLAPLSTLPGIAFVGLQRPPLRTASPDGLLAADWGPKVEDSPTAASMLAALDLLVTVDTALAHLAGALGVPALVLLPWVPEWRWGLSGEASAWYPSLRLLRQGRPGDRSAPIAAAAAALSRADRRW